MHEHDAKVHRADDGDDRRRPLPGGQGSGRPERAERRIGDRGCLRHLLAEKPLPQRRLPRLLVHSSGILPGVDINDTSAVIDMLDEGVPLDEVR